MSSKQFLTEFLQVREQRKPPQHQLDWRWVERFRELASYDGHGWLTFAGPFTQEEQEQWKQHFTSLTDEAAMEKVVPLLIQSRERELEAALAEQREPKLCYPCIDILDVRRRIASLVELDVQIMQEEPNAIVRRLYHGAIEDEISFLRLIEATYEGDTQKYWHCNLSLLPLPTAEEVSYALSHIQWTVLQGVATARDTRSK